MVNNNLLNLLKAEGFKSIELLIKEEELRMPEVTRVAMKVKNQGLNLLFHAPFLSVNIASSSEAVRSRSIRIIRKIIRMANLVKSDVITLHPGRAVPMPKVLSPLICRFEKSLAIKSLKEIIKYAEEESVNIGLENMPTCKLWDLDCHTLCDNPDDLISIISSVGSPRLKVTLDVGHAVTTEGVRSFVQKLADYIVNVHLGDVHRPKYLNQAGSDVKHFGEALKALHEARYGGALIIEVDDLKRALMLKEEVQAILESVAIYLHR